MRIFLALALFLCGFLSSACGSSEPAAARAGAVDAQRVNVIRVAQQPFERVVTVNGTLAAEEQVET